MAGFVIDNSVVMAWCFGDEGRTYSDDVLESLGSTEAIAPAIWPLEIGNVLVVAERRKRLSKSASIRFIALINDPPIHVIRESPERMTKEILALVWERQLSTYDASYLDLAMRKGVPIATRDSGLKKAALGCGVQIFKPI